MKPYKRLGEDGDLKQKYEDEVIHGEDDQGIMGIKNVMCGAIKIDCFFAAAHYWTYEMSEDECKDVCGDQYWDVSFDEWYSPCEHRDYVHALWEEHGEALWEDDHWEDDHWEDDDDGMEIGDITADEVRDLVLLRSCRTGTGIDYAA